MRNTFTICISSSEVLHHNLNGESISLMTLLNEHYCLCILRMSSGHLEAVVNFLAYTLSGERGILDNGARIMIEKSYNQYSMR